MSCVFCESIRNMIGAAEGEGLHVEEICIERILYFNKGAYTGDVFRIIVELPKGSVMTVPINYCPMCGSLLAERMNYE